jgi:hypothetical protein
MLLFGRETMRYPVRVLQFLSDSVVHYFYACDRSKQVFLLPVWRDGHGVQRIFPLAPYPLDGGWRSIERAGRYLDGFWQAFGCTYLLMRSFVSHSKIYKLQSSNLHTLASHVSPILNSPSYQRAFAHHLHNHYTLTHHITPLPIFRQYHPIQSPSHQNVILSLQYLPKKSSIPEFRASARGLGFPLTLVLYHAPLIQP